MAFVKLQLCLLEIWVISFPESLRVETQKLSMRSLFNEVKSVGKLLGGKEESLASLLHDPGGSPVLVRRSSKKLVADITNNVGLFGGVVGKWHFFVAAFRAEQETAAPAIIARNPGRERSHTSGSHASVGEGVGDNERSLERNNSGHER
jgi:hypothetical protein